MALAAPHPSGAEGRTVVVTHHGSHPAFARKIDALTGSFRSDLGDMMKIHQPAARVFGHAYRRLCAHVHGTDIRNVSVGYAGELIDEPISYLREACQWDSRPAKNKGNQK